MAGARLEGQESGDELGMGLGMKSQDVDKQTILSDPQASVMSIQ